MKRSQPLVKDIRTLAGWLYGELWMFISREKLFNYFLIGKMFIYHPKN